MWKACFFELPLEAPTLAAPAASATGECSRQIASRKSGGGWGEEQSEDETLELTVQVWDEDDGAVGDFLGELQFDAQALLDMARDRRDLVRFLKRVFVVGAWFGRCIVVPVGLGVAISLEDSYRNCSTGSKGGRSWHP